MSTTIEAPTRTNDVQVRLDPAGKPIAIRHNGRIWLVDPDTGSGDLVSIEFWRLQVRPGTHSELRTVTLRREPLSTH